MLATTACSHGPRTIVLVNEDDGTYNVQYDDGDQEMGVIPEMLKPARSTDARPAANEGSTAETAEEEGRGKLGRP